MATASEASSPPIMSKCSSHFVHVNGIPTKVMKIDGQRGLVGDVKGCIEGYTSNVIFLIIPGNPGIVDFYELFMEKLFKASNNKVPVWAVSHAGHIEAPTDLQLTDKDRMSDVYSLEDQLHHKSAFISEHIPDNKRLILIGHSIGCQIILDLMKTIPHLPVLKALHLFPTIERMRVSPNGTFLGPLLKYCRWFAVAVVYLANYLSDYVKWRLVCWHFKGKKVPRCAIQGALNLFNPYVTNSAIYMAAGELRDVVNLDADTIRDHLPKLIFYYGAQDGWCPVEYYHDLKALFPDGDIRLCERGIEHAFVLESSELMADLVWNWMEDDILSTQ